MKGKIEQNNLYEIKKSKFFSFAYCVENETDINQYLSNIKAEYSKATHICYAYVLKSPSLEKCSDDGEPNGTAGKPLLGLLKKRNLNNLLLVVVRYFGGIKLGGGGLIRAYLASGNLAVNNYTVK